VLCIILLLRTIDAYNFNSFSTSKCSISSRSCKLNTNGYDNINNRRTKESRLTMTIKGPVRYSTRDWMQCLLTLPSSRILQRVKYNVLFITIWTACWTILLKTTSLTRKLNFPSTVHSIAGTALGLLLVFRTNASYDRFWEGRKLWSNIIVACRDMAINSFIHIDKSHHNKISNLMVAYVISLKQHIQGEVEKSELAPFVSNKDLEQTYRTSLRTRNGPNQFLRSLALEVHKCVRAKYHDPLEATFHEHSFTAALHALTSSAAGCERIVKQPIPLAYTRHTSRFLTLYLLTLPLTLIPSMGYATIPTMLALAWSFASIQEIGLFIEDPFNKDFQIIPLNQIICIIRSDISEVLDGAIDSPEMETFDQKMLLSMKTRTRMQDDSYYAYYYDIGENKEGNNE